MFLVLLLILIITPVATESRNETNLKVGDKAPLFSLQDLNNKYIFLRDYCGDELRNPWKNKEKQVVVVSFFATWCTPCKKEVPQLEKLMQRFSGSKVRFLLVDTGEKPEVVAKYFKQNPTTLTVLQDSYKTTAQKYDVDSLPRLFVIDKQGTIRHIRRGFKNEGTFIREMESLIQSLL